MQNKLMDYKKMRLYKILKIFYILSYLLIIYLVFNIAFLSSRRNVGVTAMMMDVRTATISAVVNTILLVLLLVFFKMFILNYLYKKNKIRIKISIVIIFFLTFLLGVANGYFTDRIDKYFNVFYEQEDRIYQECRQKYQNSNTSSTTVESPYDPCILMGKPVIYLYPKGTSNVTVKVNPIGGITKTEPLYSESSGWQVEARPNGELINMLDGKKYPYLFWEGSGYSERIRPKDGFLIKQSEVHVKMIELLKKCGLSNKEINDFMEFWEPRLVVKPYVWVTFLDQDVIDNIAPLKIVPDPDSVIRVFFDYVLSDKPILTPEQHITTPLRTGFTVVEWGGALHY